MYLTFIEPGNHPCDCDEESGAGSSENWTFLQRHCGSELGGGRVHLLRSHPEPSVSALGDGQKLQTPESLDVSLA